MITEQQVVMTSVLVCLVGLVAFTIGLWVGHGREREYVQQLEDELGERMALGGRPPEVAHEERRPVHMHQGPALASAREHDPDFEDCWCGYVGGAIDLRVQAGAATDPQRSTDRSPRVGSPLAPAHPETVLVPSVVIPPDPPASVTAWTKAMAADMDRFIAGLIESTDEQLREITR